MDKIAIIPLRRGSKGIPGKNIRNFCNKPLAFWSINSLVDAHLFSKIIVATDGPKISQVIRNFNFPNVEIYKRSFQSALDTAPTEVVLLEVLNYYNISNETIVYLVQATNPLVTHIDFIASLDLFCSSPYDSILSAVNTKHFYWTLDNIPINYNYNNRPRRQDHKGIYKENGAFYINTAKNIMTYKNRLSGNIGIYEMKHYTEIELDTEDNWIYCECLMKKYILQNENI